MVGVILIYIRMSSFRLVISIASKYSCLLSCLLRTKSSIITLACSRTINNMVFSKFILRCQINTTSTSLQTIDFVKYMPNELEYINFPHKSLDLFATSLVATHILTFLQRQQASYF